MSQKSVLSYHIIGKIRYVRGVYGIYSCRCFSLVHKIFKNNTVKLLLKSEHAFATVPTSIYDNLREAALLTAIKYPNQTF